MITSPPATILPPIIEGTHTMQILSDAEIDAVAGGYVDAVYGRSFDGKDAKMHGKIVIWGGGDAVGANRLDYEKYLKALDAWIAKNPNKDPSLFDSIYYRY
jgi:hypothetical protein